MSTKDSVSGSERDTKPSADGDNNHRSEGGDNGSVRKIANVPANQLEGLLRKIYDEDPDKFVELSVAVIRRELEKRLNLPDRTLKNAHGLVALIEQFDLELQTKKDKSKEKDKENREKDRERKEKENEREKHKSNHSDKDRKSSHRSSHRKSHDKKPKRKRDSDSWDSDRPSKKPKRYSSSSESYESDRKRRKGRKKTSNDPLVEKNEELKKIIRGCGVQLIGFSRHMTEEEVNKKLKRIIRDHEDEGMKEKMRSNEIKKVRASILGKREIEELRQIPEILRIPEQKTKGSRKQEVRKVVKKRQSNDLTYVYKFPNTGDPYIDKESESESLSNSHPRKDKDWTDKPTKKK